MCKGKFDNCYLENPGSDADDHYYDADAENDSDKKDEYYRNNQFASVGTGWKTKSMLPVSYFMKMLQKNREKNETFQNLGKDTYEQEMVQLKSKKMARDNAREVNRELKTIKNFEKFKFSTKSETSMKNKEINWYDEINEFDKKYCS